jgi:condensin complex subunit 3
VFVEHCIKNNNEARLEAAALPVVTAFAFHTQEAYNRLLNVLQKIEAAKIAAGSGDEYEGEDALEEELAKKEVTLGELLRMALKFDYMDEIGRRKVFTVVSASSVAFSSRYELMNVQRKCWLTHSYRQVSSNVVLTF